GQRPPKRWERKRPEIAFQAADHLQWRTMNIENLVAIDSVMRLRCDAKIDRSPLIEPPKQFGASEFFAALRRPVAGSDVERLGFDELVALLPKTNFASIAKKPAVCDNAVPAWQLAGQERRLRRARYGRNDFTQGNAPSRRS